MKAILQVKGDLRLSDLFAKHEKNPLKYNTSCGMQECSAMDILEAFEENNILYEEIDVDPRKEFEKVMYQTTAISNLVADMRIALTEFVTDVAMESEVQQLMFMLTQATEAYNHIMKQQ